MAETDMIETELDTRFTMPAVDQPALTEIGVILSGLAADRLLAGLGLGTTTSAWSYVEPTQPGLVELVLGASADADDPALVTLLVDQLRHRDPAAMAEATAIGAHRWRMARPGLAAVDRGPSVSASVRQAWQRALLTVRAADLGDTAISPAAHAYLAACWLRCTEIDTAADRLRGYATASREPR
jgi:hypothetical protein